MTVEMLRITAIEHAPTQEHLFCCVTQQHSCNRFETTWFDWN